MPEVSAIIAVRNQARFVRDAIISVLGQRGARVECVVVDDGSTDGTREIIDSFGDAIRPVHMKQSGVAAARNAGVESASAGLIAFLDGDDVWVSDKIKRQLEAMRSDAKIDFSYSAMYRTDERLRVLELMPAPNKHAAWFNTLMLTQPSIFLCQTAILTRELFEGVGGFQEDLSVAADYDLIARLSGRASAVMVDAPLAFYRMHAEQMHANLPRLNDDVLRALALLQRDGLISISTGDAARRSLAFQIGIHLFSIGRWAEGVRKLGSAGRSAPRLASAYVWRRAVGHLSN